MLGGWAAIFAAYGVDAPLLDQWATPLHQLVLARDGRLTLADLARQHNEARKVVPNLVSLALAHHAGHYDTQRELFIGIVLFAGTLGSVVLATRRATSGAATASIAAWLAALGWSAHTSRLHMCSVTFERLLPEFALAAALSMFALRGVTWPCTLAAAALAALAQYSFPSGILVWALLAVYIGLVAPARTLPKIGLLVAGAIASSVPYFHGYVLPAGHSAPSAVLDEPPWRIARFVLAFLGNAFSRDLVLGELLGAAGLVGYGWLVWRFLRRPAPPARRRVEAMWVLLGAYSVSQAAIAAAGRLPMGDGHATRPDYVLHAIYLYAAIAALILLRLPEGRLRLAVPGLVLVAIGWAASLLGDGFWSNLQRDRQVRLHGKACALLIRLHRDEACLAQLYPPAQIAHRIAFAGSLLQPAPLDRLRIAGEGEGAVETVALRADGVVVSGWAVREGAPADAVVLTAAPDGEQERILAIVPVGQPRPAVALRAPIRRDRVGWEAKLPGTAAIDACQLRAYAFDTTGGFLHPLPGLGEACRAGPRG